MLNRDMEEGAVKTNGGNCPNAVHTWTAASMSRDG